MPPNDGGARKPPRGASQRGRRNSTKQSSFDQHSLLGVAIGRLSNWRSGFSVGINALERRLDGSKRGPLNGRAPMAPGPLPSNGCEPMPTRGRKWINALERRLYAPETGLDANG